MEQALAVVLVLVLLAAALWLLRAKGFARFSAGPVRKKDGLLAAVERLPLGPQHTLHLVRVGNRAVLVGVSPAGCTLLESAPWQEMERLARAAGDTQ